MTNWEWFVETERTHRQTRPYVSGKRKLEGYDSIFSPEQFREVRQQHGDQTPVYRLWVWCADCGTWCRVWTCGIVDAFNAGVPAASP